MPLAGTMDSYSEGSQSYPLEPASKLSSFPAREVEFSLLASSEKSKRSERKGFNAAEDQCSLALLTQKLEDFLSSSWLR